jgi:hypothetical protein
MVAALFAHPRAFRDRGEPGFVLGGADHSLDFQHRRATPMTTIAATMIAVHQQV